MTYRLEVNGIEPNLLAVLLHNGNEIVSTTVRSVKEAEKWAQAQAEAHKAENMPATVRNFTKTFAL